MSEGTISPQDLITEAAELYGSESPEYNHALVDLVNRCLGRTPDDLDATRAQITTNV
jgi:hypothetical protein